MGQQKRAPSKPDLTEDAALLGAYVAGDGRAFAQLYDRYDRPCFLFSRRLLGAAYSDAAEDLHQDTWIAISKNAGAFDPLKASFPAWLFTIARRKVWDHFRRQKAVLTVSDQGEAAMTIPDEGPTPLDHVASRELAERLVAAVEALPLAQRDTSVMFAHAGLSLEEISTVAGVGLETTKSRLRYARSTLRAALAAERPAHA